jgi:hypothetical protein
MGHAADDEEEDAVDLAFGRLCETGKRGLFALRFRTNILRGRILEVENLGKAESGEGTDAEEIAAWETGGELGKHGTPLWSEEGSRRGGCIISADRHAMKRRLAGMRPIVLNERQAGFEEADNGE